jgi:hypothetical protein
MAVLNTTSPNASSPAPISAPSKRRPSSRRR